MLFFFSFALIYKLNQYILISDSQSGSNSNTIKTNILPEYYSKSQSSSNYINSDSILKTSTSFKDSFSSDISSTLKTSIPSILSSSSTISKISSSSLKNPSTSIPTTISSSTIPFYSSSVKYSHISSNEIQKTTTLYSSHSILNSILISSHETTNFILRGMSDDDGHPAGTKQQ